MTHSPEIAFDIVKGQTTAGLSEHKVLIVGQMLVGSATPLTLYKNITNNNVASLFGANSVVADMVNEFQITNNFNQVDVLPVADDITGTVATASITFDGKATENGILTFYITKKQWGMSTDNRDNTKIVLSVSKDDTDEAITAKLKNMLTATNAIYALVTSGDTKVVNLASTNKGEVGNSYFLGVEGSVAGVNVALAGFAGGTKAPTITTANLVEIIGINQYKTIIWQPTLDLNIIKKFVEDRYKLVFRDLSGVAITGNIDSVDNLITISPLLQEKLISAASDKLNTKANHIGGSLGLPAHILAANLGAIRALKLTPGSSLSGIVSTTSIVMQNGGLTATPLPYFNCKLNNFSMEHLEYNFTDEEMVKLANNGISYFDYDTTSASVVLGTVSTLTTADAEDTFHYLEPVDTVLLTREYFANNYKQRYSQNTLTESQTVVNDNQITDVTIKAFNIELYSNLVAAGVLDGAGQDVFAKTMVVKIDTTGAITKAATGVARPGSVIMSYTILPVGQARSYVVSMIVNNQ